MKLVKVKTNLGSEILINIDRIDYINPALSAVNFSNNYVMLNDESMKKVMYVIELEGLKERMSE